MVKNVPQCNKITDATHIFLEIGPTLVKEFIFQAITSILLGSVGRKETTHEVPKSLIGVTKLC